jgi:hypothetical protein
MSNVNNILYWSFGLQSPSSPELPYFPLSIFSIRILPSAHEVGPSIPGSPICSPAFDFLPNFKKMEYFQKLLMRKY